MKEDKRYLKAVGVTLVALTIATIWGGYSRKHFYFNFTESEPVGLYKVSPLKGELRRGDLVLFYPPKEFESYVYGRHWLPAGWPLLKDVEGVPGDRFCITGSTFLIDGKRVGMVFGSDSEGLPLPRLQGCFKVRAGYFLPVATHTRNSFDGRYMGDIPQTAIIANAKPVWTR